MNIIMNAEGMTFGSELKKFKNSTKAMAPPHRGHMLDINDFIRAIHNSVARYVFHITCYISNLSTDGHTV